MQATAAISQTIQLRTAVLALLCLAAPALSDGKLYTESDGSTACIVGVPPTRENPRE